MHNMSQSLSQSLDQPAPTQSTADNDDYPGDEELSRMDLSRVDVLNNSPSNAHALPTFMSPQTPARQLFRNQTSPPQGLEPQTPARRGFEPRTSTLLAPQTPALQTPARQTPARQGFEHQNIALQGFSPQSPALHKVSNMSTRSSNDPRQYKDAGVCCLRTHRTILPLSLSNPSCYAIRGRELMLYKDL
jgi:hypothetical protein